MKNLNKHLVLVGATATGKSDFAIKLAQKMNSEIISLDSMQIYKGMEIGTGVIEDQQNIAHHMISTIEPIQEFSVKQFQEKVYEILERKNSPFVLVGGTGLYTHAIIDGYEFAPTDTQARRDVIEKYELDENNPDLEKVSEAYEFLQEIDPAAAEKIDPLNVRRIIRALEPYEISGTKFSESGHGVQSFDNPKLNVCIIGLRYERDDLKNRIAQRIDNMFNQGWINEVKSLVPIWRQMTSPSRNAIGYPIIYEWIENGAKDKEIDDIKEKIINKTAQFSRRQRKWFERDPRISWIECGDKSEAEIMDELLKNAYKQGVHLGETV